MNDCQLSFVFDPDRCIQCLGCEGACSVWRATGHGIRWRRVETIWKGAYPDVMCRAVSVSCQHCAEPACVSACPSGAISKCDDGLVLVDSAACTGCRACLTACPYGVPQFGADGLMQKCDMCRSAVFGGVPPCVHTCPTGALSLETLSLHQKKDTEQALIDALNHKK